MSRLVPVLMPGQRAGGRGPGGRGADGAAKFRPRGLPAVRPMMRPTPTPPAPKAPVVQPAAERVDSDLSSEDEEEKEEEVVRAAEEEEEGERNEGTRGGDGGAAMEEERRGEEERHVEDRPAVLIAPTLVDQVVEREVSRPQEAPPPVEAQQLSQQGPPPLLLPWPLREAVEEARKRAESGEGFEEEEDDDDVPLSRSFIPRARGRGSSGATTRGRGSSSESSRGGSRGRLVAKRRGGRPAAEVESGRGRGGRKRRALRATLSEVDEDDEDEEEEQQEEEEEWTPPSSGGAGRGRKRRRAAAGGAGVQLTPADDASVGDNDSTSTTRTMREYLSQFRNKTKQLPGLKMLTTVQNKPANNANKKKDAAPPPAALPAPAPAPAVVGPQVQLSETGEIIINQSSLEVSRVEVEEEVMEEVYEDPDHRATYSSFTNKKQTKRWTVEETRDFYKALRQFGTDFTTMEVMFPQRDRRQLKNKFKKEERERPDLVYRYLDSQQPLDLQTFEASMSLLESHAGARVNADVQGGGAEATGGAAAPDAQPAPSAAGGGAGAVEIRNIVAV